MTPALITALPSVRSTNWRAHRVPCRRPIERTRDDNRAGPKNCRQSTIASVKFDKVADIAEACFSVVFCTARCCCDACRFCARDDSNRRLVSTSDAMLYQSRQSLRITSVRRPTLCAEPNADVSSRIATPSSPCSSSRQRGFTQ